jgi:hypothetical protein
MTIKTQGGKVITKDGKVSCECCECQPLNGRTLNSLTNGTSVEDFWNKEKLDHFWKKEFRVQGYLTIPSPVGNFTHNFDIVSNKPECLYKPTFKNTTVFIDIPSPDYPDEIIGQIEVDITLYHDATKIIDGENVYYGFYADSESTNQPDSGLLDIYTNVNVYNQSHEFFAYYVSAIGILPYFDFQPFYRSDILPVTSQIMINPSKPELGDYQFYKYSLVGSCDGSCSQQGNWYYTGYYPTVNLILFTQV